MGSYIPNPNALVLSVQGEYDAPAAANVVLDVPSPDAAQTFVSGTVSLNGEPVDQRNRGRLIPRPTTARSIAGAY